MAELPRVESKADLRAQVALWRSSGERIAFVPTMGALHRGHLSLVEIGRARADRVVVSIFVNPAQFGPHEDFKSYPRSVDRDCALLAEVGVDLVFLPEVETIYPPGSSTWVTVEGVSEGLEGDCRPGHFRGVATVVLKLFQLVAPDLAIFGEKDAQQLAVVRRMARDLCLPIEIVGGAIQREPDGLALSSRNAYLDADERQAATVLSRSLRHAKTLIESGERSSAKIIDAVSGVLAAEPRGQIEYVGVVDAESFSQVQTLSGRCVVPIVFRIGKTRLLDNFQIEIQNGVASAGL